MTKRLRQKTLIVWCTDSQHSDIGIWAEYLGFRKRSHFIRWLFNVAIRSPEFHAAWDKVQSQKAIGGAK